MLDNISQIPVEHMVIVIGYCSPLQHYEQMMVKEFYFRKMVEISGTRSSIQG